MKIKDLVDKIHRNGCIMGLEFRSNIPEIAYCKRNAVGRYLIVINEKLKENPKVINIILKHEIGHILFYHIASHATAVNVLIATINNSDLSERFEDLDYDHKDRLILDILNIVHDIEVNDNILTQSEIDYMRSQKLSPVTHETFDLLPGLSNEEYYYPVTKALLDQMSQSESLEDYIKNILQNMSFDSNEENLGDDDNSISQDIYKSLNPSKDQDNQNGEGDDPNGESTESKDKSGDKSKGEYDGGNPKDSNDNKSSDEDKDTDKAESKSSNDDGDSKNDSKSNDGAESDNGSSGEEDPDSKPIDKQIGNSGESLPLSNDQLDELIEELSKVDGEINPQDYNPTGDTYKRVQLEIQRIDPNRVYKADNSRNAQIAFYLTNRIFRIILESVIKYNNLYLYIKKGIPVFAPVRLIDRLHIKLRKYLVIFDVSISTSLCMEAVHNTLNTMENLRKVGKIHKESIIIYCNDDVVASIKMDEPIVAPNPFGGTQLHKAFEKEYVPKGVTDIVLVTDMGTDLKLLKEKLIEFKGIANVYGLFFGTEDRFQDMRYLFKEYRIF